VLVAFGNGLALFAIAGFVLLEAAHRLASPVEVLGAPMLAIAAAGLVVNLVMLAVLHGGDRHNLNMRGALLHVVGDLLGSVGAIAAAAVVLLTGWSAADPLISVLVAVLILSGAWRLVRDSGHILLEGAPPRVSSAEITADLVAHVAGVIGVHHVHAWAITEERVMATLHAELSPAADGHATVCAIKARLAERFGIAHATVEVEHGACADDAPLAPFRLGRAHDHDHGPHGHRHD
jgi:cobalt-zinc-cadmium efflux system protein